MMSNLIPILKAIFKKAAPFFSIMAKLLILHYDPRLVNTWAHLFRQRSPDIEVLTTSKPNEAVDMLAKNPDAFLCDGTLVGIIHGVNGTSLDLEAVRGQYPDLPIVGIGPYTNHNTEHLTRRLINITSFQQIYDGVAAVLPR